jgi:hypothetical protein
LAVEISETAAALIRAREVDTIRNMEALVRHLREIEQSCATERKEVEAYLQYVKQFPIDARLK